MVQPDQYHLAPFTNLQMDSDLASIASLRKNFKNKFKNKKNKKL